MKQTTYIKYRKEFLNQYKLLDKNELGFVKLNLFNIRNFKKFIYLYSIDNPSSKYNNTVSNIDKSRYEVKHGFATSIKIDNIEKSMFDKYADMYDKVITTL